MVPRFIPPCLPSPAERLPSGPGWVHEIKHDGFRMMIRRDGAGVRLFTRNGHDWTDRYPLIAEAAGALRARSCLIDGRRSPATATACRCQVEQLRGSGHRSGYAEECRSDGVEKFHWKACRCVSGRLSQVG
jgi:ATP-dependent DNA ligase